MISHISGKLERIAAAMTAGTVDRLMGAAQIRGVLEQVRGAEKCTDMIGALLALDGEQVCAELNPNTWQYTGPRERARIVEQADAFLRAVRDLVGKSGKART